ncbi:MAG: 4-hydroxy-tetrahydrodipicolinate synthase [Patescibacteria group bacterium]
MKDLSTYPVWTAVITPMNADGSVDYDSLKSVLQDQAKAGNAITILGSTGEALNIDDSERKQILEFAIGLKLDVPMMVGVGGINLNTQLAWIDYLNTLEVDNYLLVVPLYAKPGINGQYGWFKALLDRANKPCTLYNIPGRTAAKLEVETLKRLRDHPNLWGIKEASGSEAEFAAYAKAAPGAVMLSGDDPLLPAFARLGAKGVVSVASNAWPEATHEVAKQCVGGRFKDEELWSEATSALFCASNPIPVKALMHDQGKIKTPELRLPLSSQDMPDMSTVREANKAIEAWLKKI